jgi:hypothetical protein
VRRTVKSTTPESLVKQACDHGHYDSHVHWPYKWCPGGKEIVLRQESVFDMDTCTQRKVWVEADDG